MIEKLLKACSFVRARVLWVGSRIFMGPYYPYRMGCQMCWIGRYRITWIARVPGLKWTDGLLASALGVRPRFLTNRIAKITSNVQVNIFERLKRWLWQEQSPIKTSMVLLLLSIDICLIAWMIGKVLGPFSPVEAVVGWAAPDLVSLAAFAGTIFVFVQAVAIVAAQMGNRSADVAIWMSEYFVGHALALSGSVALANIIGILMGMIIQGESVYFLTPLIWLNLFLLPGTTAFSLWVMLRILTDSQARDYSSVLPIVNATMDLLYLENKKIQEINLLGATLSKSIGIEYTSWYSVTHSSRTSSDRPVASSPDKARIDIDCYALESAARVARDVNQLDKLILTVLPGVQSGNDHSIIARFKELDDSTISEILSTSEWKVLTRVAKTVVVGFGRRTK